LKDVLNQSKLFFRLNSSLFAKGLAERPCIPTVINIVRKTKPWRRPAPRIPACSNLIEKREQLVVFPEGKINKHGKKLVLKEGLYRLARLATRKTTSITIIPIGIAYSKVPPSFRGEFCLSFGKPIPINNYLNFSIKDFNKFLNEKMTKEEEKALKNVGR